MPESNRRRRFGVTQDVELENRLSYLEREVAKLSPVDRNLDTIRRRMVNTTPTQVVNVAVQKSPGTITVQWDKLNITNISYYEVWVAENASFTGTVTKAKVEDAFYTYQDASADNVTSTFYARVRGIINNSAGLWSATVSSALGLSGTDSLASNSVTVVAEEIVTTFVPASLVVNTAFGTASESYGNLSIEATEDGTVAPRVNFQTAATYTGSTLNPLELDILIKRDPGSVTVGTFKEVFVNNKTADAVTYGGFAEYDDPGAGTFTYSVDVSIAATGASGTATADPGFVPTRLIIQLLEYRR